VSAKNDAEAIAKEAAKVADEDTLQELYGGEEVDPNSECRDWALWCLSSVVNDKADRYCFDRQSSTT
jgi:hypothetical protein